MIRTLLFSTLLAALAGCSFQTAPKSTEAPAKTPTAATPAAASTTPAPSPPPVAQTTPAAPAAAPAGSLATQDTNVAGVAADFTECRRKEGVLNVKVRFRNTSAAEAHIYVINGRNYPAFYVTAANKKYFILTDSDGSYLTPATDGTGTLSVSLPVGGQYTWWAKFPAPPADVKKVTLMTPHAPPFEDVPVTDQ
jgi:hypothetical protein